MNQPQSALSYKWYMIATISCKEESVIESLKTRKIKENIVELRDFYVAIIPHLTPSGKKRRKNLFPGYIFIEMVMTDDIWLIIRNTENVTGLIGSSGQRTKPTPLSTREIQNVWEKVKKIESDFEKGGEEPKIDFEVGDNIVVIKGPMQSEVGKVIEINLKTNKAIIEIEVFGKRVPTQIAIKNIAKIKD